MRHNLVLSMALGIATAAVVLLGGVAFSDQAPLYQPADPPVVEANGAEQGPVCAPPMTEADAHMEVWALAEVQQKAEELRRQGARPVTITVSDPGSAESGSYTIALEESTPDHVVPVATYLVDACSRQVLRYDVITDQAVPPSLVQPCS